MSFRVENHILGFEITIDNSVAMEALESEDNLCSIESSSLFAEFAFLSQMKEEFASIEEVNNKVEAFWCLESIVQLDDERMADTFQDHSLN